MAQSPVTTSAGTAMVISGDEIPYGAYQAIYHKLTKRVETHKNDYDGAYDLGFADIKNLHQRFSQLIKQYQVRAVRCTVSHSLSGDSRRSHSSFEKFSASDCSVRAVTKEFNYEIDFLIILPPEVPEASEIAQRYKVSLSIDQDFVDDNDIDTPYFLRNFLSGDNIKLTVEFADYAVYQAIRATVDGWVQSLPIRTRSSTVIILTKMERTAKEIIPNVVRLAGILGIASYAFSQTSITSSYAAYLTLVGIALGFTSFAIVTYLLDGFYRILTRFKPMTFLKLTAGDSDRADKIVREKIVLKRSISFVSLAIIMTAAVNIFSNFIYDAIK